jgi:hypothetical protein
MDSVRLDTLYSIMPEMNGQLPPGILRVFCYIKDCILGMTELLTTLMQAVFYYSSETVISFAFN